MAKLVICNRNREYIMQIESSIPFVNEHSFKSLIFAQRKIFPKIIFVENFTSYVVILFCLIILCICGVC